MKIFISGLLNLETTVKIRKFPIEYYPIDYPFFGINSCVSGVAYNIAKAFTVLGDDVNLFSFIGKDNEAKLVLESLKKEKIANKNILHKLKKTPASVVLFDEQGKRQIYCDLKDIQEQNVNYNDVKEIDESDLFVICNTNFNRNLIKEAKKKEKLVATDVHVLNNIYDEYNTDFMKYSDILFLSDENLPCGDVDFIKQIANEYNNKVIVMGCGGKGAILFDRSINKIFRFDCVKCNNIVNTVGAGDALFTSFLHFYIKGFSAVDSLKRAEIFASIKIESNGASVGFSNESIVEENVSNRSPNFFEVR